MSESLLRLKKKRAFPAQIDGGTVYVRAMTLGELRQMDSLGDDLKTPFMVGCGLCSDADGTPEFKKESDESAEKWATRIQADTDDIPVNTLKAIADAIAQVGNVPSAETVAKN